MKNQFSDLRSINLREALMGLLITLCVALVDLLWTGINPIIAEWQLNKVVDFALFTTKVNWETAIDTATMTAIAYFGVIFNSGNKAEK